MSHGNTTKGKCHGISLPAFGIAEKEGSWEEGIGTNQGEGYVQAE
jgi:hypothetical protein